MSSMIRSALILALSAAALPAHAAPTPEQARVLGRVAEDAILPAMRDADARAQALARAAAAYCTEPGPEALDAARAAWREAFLAWRRTGATGFGPALNLRIARTIDAWPARPKLIEQALTEGTAARDAGAAARGFPGLEALLFEPQAAARLAEARRCAYFAGATADTAAATAQVVRGWTEGGHAREFAGAGGFAAEPGHPYLTVNIAFTELVNRLVAELDADAGRRLAKPLGLRNHGEAQPDKLEGRLSGTARAAIQASLDGVGAALRPLLDYLTATGHRSLAAQLRNELGVAREALAALPADPAQAPKDTAARAQQAVATLQHTVETGLAPALVVTIDFNENDGD